MRRIPEGGAQYSVLCREDGGVLDDLFTYRLAECHFLTVTNAANHDKDLAWLQASTPTSSTSTWSTGSTTSRCSPCRARGRARSSPRSPTASCRRGCTAASAPWPGVPMLVCGTGYTGEDGVELLLDPGRRRRVWDALLAAGAVPVGLGARDTLRLEVCFHLYGNDLSEERGPIEAGLGWCCKEDTGFIGAEAVAAVRAAGPPRGSCRS